MISHQPLKNKLKKNRMSAHMMALRSKHKATGAHKPPLKEKHAKAGFRPAGKR